MARSLVADLSAQTTGLVTTIRPSLVPAPSPVGRDSLDELETAFARFDGRPDTAEAFRAAAERAHALVEAGGADHEAQRSASLAFAADALAAVAPERTSLTETIDDMVSTLARILEISPETVTPAQPPSLRVDSDLDDATEAKELLLQAARAWLE